MAEQKQLYPSWSAASSVDGGDCDEEVHAASSTDKLSGDSSKVETAEVKEMLWKETRTVRRSKLVVFLALVATTIAGAVSMANVIRRGELSEFDTMFQAYAREIEVGFEQNARQAFTAIRGLSQSVTSAAQIGNEAFPFVTVPFFEVQGGKAQELSGANVVLVAPMVKTSDKLRWEDYSVAKQGWLQEGLAYRGLPDVDPGPIPAEIYAYSAEEYEDHEEGEIDTDGYFLPVWQMAGAPVNASIINLDLTTRSSFEHTMADAIEQREGVLSYASDFNYLTENSLDQNIGFHIQSYFLEPVFETFENDAEVVAFVIAVFPWNRYFKNVLPEDVTIVIDNQCGDIFTYQIVEEDAAFIGSGDLHDPDYDSNVYSTDFAAISQYTGHPQLSVNGTSYTERFKETSKGRCTYVLNIYPSAELEDQFTSNDYFAYAAVVVGIFGANMALLLIYDWTVNSRHRRLMAEAERASKIVSSLFPEAVQRRLMDEAVQDGKLSGARTLKGYLGKEQLNKGMPESNFTNKPIADFFPDTTIIFADIVGFTAWSSTREPTQVFTLLETIYHAFDEIANQRRVFKVETVGDCYVAVAGLPNPRKDHAVVMGRFAHSCISKFTSLVKQMELTLGPDTGELGLRVGLHSGPVTAGVLRGEKARFQLFGDSMNTTARIETSGQRNKVHVSEATAALVSAAGKGHWLRKRPDKIVAKGKGELTTFWLVPKSGTNSSGQSSGSYSSAASSEVNAADELGDHEKRNEKAAAKAEMVQLEKKQRLVKWNTEMLLTILKTIVAFRIDSGIQPDNSSKIAELERGVSGLDAAIAGTVADEVVEVIGLPKFVIFASRELTDPDTIELPEAAVSQLEDYVQAIAAMYPENPFHNFEHASHVALSVQKLLCRIEAPELDWSTPGLEAALSLHDHTYGITSDPLIHFAVVLAALVHDVDHPGVPNSTLVLEKTSLAAVYKNKSVAEQNSVDLAWDLLMDDAFVDLRQVLYTTEADFKRTRQLIVNSVMATDIMDKELGAFRKARWEKAFSEAPLETNSDNVVDNTESDDCAVHRKATIVLEHLIQASDVAHTMQHWHVYIKWNERLFDELYKAYLDGRADTDPSINWYKGEMGFFDFYIIPLTKKLESCGVFGVSSAECLDYAQHNRREWEMKGQRAVAGYLEKYSSSP